MNDCVKDELITYDPCTTENPCVKLSDGQCYGVDAIKEYIRKLVYHRSGNSTGSVAHLVGNPSFDYFVLPTRAPIKSEDLDLIGVIPPITHYVHELPAQTGGAGYNTKCEKLLYGGRRKSRRGRKSRHERKYK